MRKILKKTFYILILTVFVSCVNENSDNLENQQNKIKVAVFNGSGASAVCIIETYESLKIDTWI